MPPPVSRRAVKLHRLITAHVASNHVLPCARLQITSRVCRILQPTPYTGTKLVPKPKPHIAHVSTRTRIGACFIRRVLRPQHQDQGHAQQPDPEVAAELAHDHRAALFEDRGHHGRMGRKIRHGSLPVHTTRLAMLSLLSGACTTGDQVRRSSDAACAGTRVHPMTITIERRPLISSSRACCVRSQYEGVSRMQTSLRR